MPLPPLLLERLKRRKLLQAPSGALQPEDEPAPTPPPPPPPRVQRDYESPPRLQLDQQQAAEDQEEIIAEDYSDEDSDQASEPPSADRSPPAQLQASAAKPNASSPNALPNDPQSTDLLPVSLTDHDPNQQLTAAPQLPFLASSVIGCPNKYNVYHDCSQYCLDNYGIIESDSPTLEQRKLLAIILKSYPLPNDWTIVYDPGLKSFYFWNITTDMVSWFPPAMNGLVSMSADHIRFSMKSMGHMM